MARPEPSRATELCRPIDPAELAAADWLVRHDRGLTAAQSREFSHWLKADARHARIYARLEQAWGLLDRVPAERLPLPPCRSKIWLRASVALAVAASIALAFFVADPLHQTTAPVMRTAATPVGGFEQIELPDGSLVQLNTASAVAVEFTAQERRVKLTRGEATFVVVHDAARPFIVRVGHVDVRAVGTIFNVRHRPEAIEVLVTEGKVRVDDALGRDLLAGERSRPGTVASSAAGPTPDRTPTLLSAGSRATIATGRQPGSTSATIVTVTPDEVSRALAWQNRLLEFSADPLADIVAEFNRYNRQQLVIADAELAARRFGGKFPAHDAESLVLLLQSNFDVLIERRPDETILRLPPAGP